MSGKFNKKKKFNPFASFDSIKPENFIVKKGRSLPIYECRMIDGWFEGGKNQVMVVRRLPNNNFVAGFYLIDLWCLGLKDSFFRYDLTKVEYDDLIASIESNAPSAVIPASKAFNLVYAAIEYAEDLGFEPSKEFKVTQYLLDDVDDIEYEEIETGLNGKPCYYPGPDDKVEVILKKLEKKVGKGNFTFMEFAAPDDYFGDGPSKKEIIEQFFPDKKVEKKLASLKDDSDKDNFMLQTVILTLALEMAGGDVESLTEEFDDDFLEDLLEEFNLEMVEMRRMDGLPPVELTEELERTTRIFISLIVQRAIRHGNVEFMFEKDYKPTMDNFSPEDVMSLPPDQLEDFFMEAFEIMDDDGKKQTLFRMKAITTLDQTLLDDPELDVDNIDKETLLERTLQAMKEDDESDYWEKPDEQVLAKCRESVMFVIDTYKEDFED